MQLEEYRKSKDISVITAAKEIGISRQHVYDLESGSAFASRKLALRIEEWSGGLVTREDMLFPERA